MGQCVCAEALAIAQDEQAFLDEIPRPDSKQIEGAGATLHEAKRSNVVSEEVTATSASGTGSKSGSFEDDGGFCGNDVALRNRVVSDLEESTSRQRSESDTRTDVSAADTEALVWRPVVALDDGQTTYEGQWRGHVKEGKGILIRPDGSRFEGGFRANRATGWGKFTHFRGDTYEGEWVNDKASGQGTFTHSDGSCYQGGWKDDMQHGYGFEKWSDGSTFHGNYRHSKKHGKGRFEWSEGSVFDGDFADNAIHGVGTYRWADGRVYVGEWKCNHMDGSGKMTWPDGRVYDGEYKKDKKHGQGTYTWPDGKRYEGGWFEGRQHGVAHFYNSRGVRRQGEWQKGTRIRWFPPESLGEPLVKQLAMETTSELNGDGQVKATSCNSTAEVQGVVAPCDTTAVVPVAEQAEGSLAASSPTLEVAAESLKNSQNGADVGDEHSNSPHNNTNHRTPTPSAQQRSRVFSRLFGRRSGGAS